MRKEADRLSLLHKVAVLFYRESKTKDQISKIIGKTPSHVKNLLEEAKAQGIVSIKIELPRLQVLQEQLRSRFHHLREVIVIPHENDTRLLLTNLGQTAAEYFDDRVIDGANVGIGGGYLMYEMIRLMPDRERDIHIYPGAIVGRGTAILHIDPIVLVTLLWAKSGHLAGRAHYTTVTPPDKSTRREVQRYYRGLRETNKKVRELFDSMKAVDWLFASIGGLDAHEDYIAATKSATRNLLDEMSFDDTDLRSEGVAGDILYSFFDKNGNAKKTWDVVISLGVRQLKQMAANTTKHIVVVAGSYKMQALQAVIRGRLCNVLITDARAAQILVDGLT